MLKTKSEILITKLITFCSTGVSVIFSTMMLMTFASTSFEKVLYLFCGLINDGTKWFTLTIAMKNYKAKSYKKFRLWLCAFLPFFLVSIIASISFSVYTVKGQMYQVVENENMNFVVVDSKIDGLQKDIINIRDEQKSELEKINSEIASLPVTSVSRRDTLSNRKIELSTFYSDKIVALETKLNVLYEEIKELEATEQRVIEKKTLSNNSIAGFFETMANLFNVEIDSIILGFAILLGVILDCASITLTIDGQYSYTSVREANKEMTKIKNFKAMEEKIANRTGNKVIQLNSFNKFANYIIRQSIDIDDLTYADMSDKVAKGSFNKFVDKFKEKYIFNSDGTYTNIESMVSSVDETYNLGEAINYNNDMVNLRDA